MPFEFHLPSFEEMRSSPDGLEMLGMIDADDFSSALVTGCPGSGKTTLSIYRFIRLCAQDQPVFLFTYHKLLMLAIRKLAEEHGAATNRVWNFHKWYNKLTGKFIDFKGHIDYYELHHNLEITALAKNPQLELIIDEGQDLPLVVIKAVSDYCQRCFIGADDGQQVHPTFGAKTQDIQDFLSSKDGDLKVKVLGRNFRNTYETYRFARQFISKDNHAVWDPAILDRLHAQDRHGDRPEVIGYQNVEQRNEYLKTVIDNAEGNVAILCPIGPESPHGLSVDTTHQVVTSLGFAASLYHHDTPIPAVLERIVVTTYKSSKGLEFDTVIIPRINFFVGKPEEWYVACTRARRRLVIFRDLSNPEIDPIADFDPDTYIEKTLPKSASVALPF